MTVAVRLVDLARPCSQSHSRIALWAPWRSAKPVDRPLMRLDVNLGPDAIPGANSAVAISPDGTRIVFPIRGADGKPLLATRLLDQAAITPLPGTENGSDVFFSPDGQWIGFSADSKLKKVSLRGGAPVTLTDASVLLGASWGENGDIVASLNVVGGLLSIPASGGSPHAVTNLGKQEALHLLPQVLPGGNAVLFTAAQALASLDDANIEVVSLKTGAVKTLLSGGYFGRYLATNGSTGHLVYLRQGVLYAVAFDPVRLEVRGSPEQILEDVAGLVRRLPERNLCVSPRNRDRSEVARRFDGQLGQDRAVGDHPGQLLRSAVFSRWQAPCAGCGYG